MRLFASFLTALVIFATMVVPSFVQTVWETSSMAAGGLMVCGMYFALFVVFGNYLPRFRVSLIFWVFPAIGLHGIVSAISSQNFDFDRFWQSAVALAVNVSGAYCLALLAKKLPNRQADLTIGAPG